MPDDPISEDIFSAPFGTTAESSDGVFGQQNFYKLLENGDFKLLESGDFKLLE